MQSGTTSDSNSNCVICDALRDAARTEGPSRIENTPLCTTENFVVMPCIGPLVAGQVMVVSRKHVPSLASLGEEVIREYHTLASTIPQDPEFLLEAEHGATDSDCAGACVTHAHVHWIPGFQEYAEVFDGFLPQIYSGPDLRLPGPSTPYLFIRGAGGPARVFDAAGLPSQMLRQVICSELQRDDWDWRMEPRYDLIHETVEYWSSTRVRRTRS